MLSPDVHSPFSYFASISGEPIRGKNHWHNKARSSVIPSSCGKGVRTPPPILLHPAVSCYHGFCSPSIKPRNEHPPGASDETLNAYHCLSPSVLRLTGASGDKIKTVVHARLNVLTAGPFRTGLRFTGLPADVHQSGVFVQLEASLTGRQEQTPGTRQASCESPRRWTGFPPARGVLPAPASRPHGPASCE